MCRRAGTKPEEAADGSLGGRMRAGCASGTDSCCGTGVAFDAFAVAGEIAASACSIAMPASHLPRWAWREGYQYPC